MTQRDNRHLSGVVCSTDKVRQLLNNIKQYNFLIILRHSFVCCPMNITSLSIVFIDNCLWLSMVVYGCLWLYWLLCKCVVLGCLPNDSGLYALCLARIWKSYMPIWSYIGPIFSCSLSLLYFRQNLNMRQNTKPQPIPAVHSLTSEEWTTSGHLLYLLIKPVKFLYILLHKGKAGWWPLN